MPLEITQKSNLFSYNQYQQNEGVAELWVRSSNMIQKICTIMKAARKKYTNILGVWECKTERGRCDKISFSIKFDCAKLISACEIRGRK
jgi:hypothetical protein